MYYMFYICIKYDNMTYREQYEFFLEKTGQNMTYEQWLELQLTGKVITNKHKGKKVQQYNMSDMSLFGEYQSIGEAAKLTGINRTLISRNLNNPEKYKHAGGFIWRFKNEG